MANISSINGNPIVVGTSGIVDRSVIGDKLDGQLLAEVSSSVALSQDDIENGRWNTGTGKASDARRIRSKVLYRTYYGGRVVVSSGTTSPYVDIVLFDNSSCEHVLYESGWITGDVDITLAVPEGGYLSLQFANGASYNTSTNITYTAFDSEVILYVSAGSANANAIGMLSDEMHYYAVPVNLVGNVDARSGGVYKLPHALELGEKLTFSTSDGGPNERYREVRFYDANKQYLSYFSFSAGATKRTISIPDNLVGSEYIGVAYTSDTQRVQVQFGDIATEYQEQFYSARVIGELLEDVSDSALSSKTFNAAYHVGATDFREKCQEFSALMYGDTIASVSAPADCESFLFFTDPHLLEGTGWEYRCQEFVSQIQKYYNSTPTSFCVCGGDWLGNSDLPEDACFKMGYIDGFMHSMFDNVHMLVGNHDTNYQGKLTPESSTYTTRLSDQSIRNLWYRGSKAYYDFMGANTRFFCFDTGTERQALDTFNGYGWEQAEWFASELESNASDHIVILAHMLYWQLTNRPVQPLAQELLDIAAAFNARTTITVNGNEHDYSTAHGRVEFYLAGHNHDDDVYAINGIPCVVTTNVRHDESYGPSFDLMFIDYDEREVKCIRVGSGSNRTVSLDVE